MDDEIHGCRILDDDLFPIYNEAISEFGEVAGGVLTAHDPPVAAHIYHQLNITRLATLQNNSF